MKFYNVHVAERFLFDVKDSSHINQISLGWGHLCMEKEILK